MFVDRAALERLLAREARSSQARPAAMHAGTHEPAAHASEPVRYLHCPACKGVMNRVHFAHRSGIVVNVCRAHGTWFDTGELTAVIEFVGRGG
jgi:Zn-finger nucleic acid-binding protein